MNRDYSGVIAKAYPVPAHIAAIANAVRYDLLHGPSFLLIPGGDLTRVNDDCLASLYEDLEPEPGDEVEQTYVGRAATALREYLTDLPGDLWLDTDAGCVETAEPKPWQDDDGEWIEPYWQSYRHLEQRDVIEALFGTTIAREFH